MSTVDKNKPGTWRPYRSSLCKSCYATCCTMPLEIKLLDLLRMGLISVDEADLSSKRDLQKVVKHLQKQGIVKTYRESTGLFLLESKPNGDCLFLDSNIRSCKIYENRPQVCRSFPETMGLRPRFCPYIKKQ